MSIKKNKVKVPAIGHMTYHAPPATTITTCHLSLPDITRYNHSYYLFGSLNIICYYHNYRSPDLFDTTYYYNKYRSSWLIMNNILLLNNFLDFLYQVTIHLDYKELIRLLELRN